ncbi:tubulin binding cofactor C-domain-containing protein [Pyronema omphalodes]|nr:tubulin binding cofactor C-domain-containing protein [Pyronema omphalodes]
MTSLPNRQTVDKDTIHSTFNSEYRALETLLQTLPTLPASSRPATIDHLLSGISHLSSLLQDAASYLPAYDQRSYALKLKTLSEQLSSLRSQLAPKAKFSFKSRKGDGKGIIGGAVGLGSSGEGEGSEGGEGKGNTAAERKAAAELENMKLENIAGEYIRPSISTIPGGAVATTAAASLLVSNIKDSIMVIPEQIKFSSASVKDVSNSVLVFGKAVGGPVHITGLRDCVLVLECRQFRMHDARQVDVYLRIGSRPIIEDCEGVRFHRYGGGLGEDGQDEGNMWDQVDDFKWLKSGPNPHWKAVGEEKDQLWKQMQEKEVGQLEVQKVLEELIKKGE